MFERNNTAIKKTKNKTYRHTHTHTHTHTQANTHYAKRNSPA